MGSGVTLSPDGDSFATGITTVGSLNVSTGFLKIPDSIIHVGDANTKIRFPAADTISMETAGSEAARFDSNGYLGLHITDPHLYYSKTLVVGAETEGDGGGITIKGAGSDTNYLMFADSNSGAGRYDGYVGYSHGSQKLYLATAGGSRADIDSSGNLSITNGNLVIGTSGKGIDFSATSDASGSTSELLDDYEEGSWTATVTYSNSGSATLSESLGFYTKIGNQVHIQAAITFSAQGSGSGNVKINGLPFTSSGDNGKRINGFMTYATGFSSLNSIPVLYVAGAYTYMEIFHLGQSNGTATGITNVTRNNCSSNTTIRLYAAYTV